MKPNTPTSAANSPYFIEGKEFSAPALTPGLYLTATPIGNLADISLRALSTLAAADMILCEDTRITRKLLDRYGIENVLHAYHDHNGAQMRPQVLKWLEGGKVIALVSDAGMPVVSDPGYKLARAVREHGSKVYVVPGASAPLAGLALSGLPSDRFLFAGFLPNKSAARRTVLSELSGINATLIFFESIKRLEKSLSDIDAILGDRPVSIAREITKLHEEVITGTPSELADKLTVRKGEVTLLIGPPEGDAVIDDATIDSALTEAMENMAPGKAAAQVSKELGVSRQELYQRAMKLKSNFEEK
ncbi:MAG: 16S rRNA (cytidine(1402)-2'-O)-methyltransferase [Hyphomicrobiales bacterium]